MRRVVVIVPELLGEPSVLLPGPEGLSRLAGAGSVFGIEAMPPIETPEALFLGMQPGDAQMRQGPLTVAALGADPPPRSTHFHLSLMSYSDGIATGPRDPIDGRTLRVPAGELRTILDLGKKLNSRSLTLVEGQDLDHGLVWEGLGDLRTVSARDVDGQPVRARLPEGDAEVALRRYIDDSINLLSEIDINQRRVDEGLPALNLLWPWGEGVRASVPNLALRRGEPSLVIGASMRLAGLARLAGLRPANPHIYGHGTNTRFKEIAELVLRDSSSLVVFDAVAGFREANKLEEADWLAREMSANLIVPLLDASLLSSLRITLLAPGSGRGLGCRYQTGESSSNTFPLDERALDERGLPFRGLAECVEDSLVD